MKHDNNIFYIHIEETKLYTLSELCEICGIHADMIVEMVEYGIIEPMGESQQQWLFAEPALVRTKTALRLQKDLQINLSGLALVLDLLEEVDELRDKVNSLEQLLKSLGKYTK